MKVSIVLYSNHLMQNYFNKMEIKERIIHKSNEMFFRYGVKSVTMDDIAQELGISKKTIYQHFEESQAANAQRLRAFVATAAQARLAGNHFDDIASAQGLLDYFLRARACQALSTEEIEALTGLSREQLETRSFAQILATPPSRT